MCLKRFQEEENPKIKQTLTHLFNSFSLKTCDLPTGGVIEGQFCIWVATRIKYAALLAS